MDVAVILNDAEQALLLANEWNDAAAWSSVAAKIKAAQAAAENVGDYYATGMGGE